MIAITGVLSVLIVGVSLLIALRLLYPSGSAAHFWFTVLATTGWAFMVIGLLGLCLAIQPILGVVIFAATCVVAVTFVARHLLARRSTLLALLATAAERGMPLDESVRAFAAEQSGWWRAQLLQFAKDLSSGMSLASAIQRTPSVLPREALIAAEVGQRTGRLGIALSEALASGGKLHLLANAVVARMVYVLLISGTAVGVTVFLSYYIAPQMQKIFYDFDPRMRMPALSLVLASLIDYFGPVFASLCVALALCCVYGLLIYMGLISARFGPLEPLFIRFDRSAVLGALSLLVAREHDLHTLGVLANAYPKRGIRLRLRSAALALASGQPWIESLRRQGLVSAADASVLSAAERVGNLPWAMHELADANERRAIYRIETLMAVGMPIVVLLLGCMVAVIVIGWFMPLVALITNLT